MPGQYDDIIRQMLDAHQIGELGTLMQDPRRMENTVEGGMWANNDMMYNPQSYATMDAPPRSMLDPLRQGEKYEDSATMDQYNRDEQELNRGIRQYPTTPSVDPRARPVDPDRDDLDMLFPNYSKTDPNVPNMQKLYRQMPMQKPPQPRGQMQTPDQFQMYNVPKQYEQPDLDTMQQLQQFFMGGSEI